ncbi:hypothetical protein IQ265_14830 [Nodosilinea sp. LEGE 06152]|uniref:hypothetical protein n=1 Tax=Nodosilinea sp. LEGE 06152 TaxID=2777966 RepID=UPI001880FAB6|nr:hypothetical protein [Nodosilinea sp. LEGE 06152]MBE9158092.1 hypothetical protein [Nodosilinea sp. LEGE 06152]
MIRNSDLVDRLTSPKSIGAVLLAIGALVLPACGVGQEEGLGEDQKRYQEEGGGLGEEGLGEEEGIGEEEADDD